MQLCPSAWVVCVPKLSTFLAEAVLCFGSAAAAHCLMCFKKMIAWTTSNGNRTILILSHAAQKSGLSICGKKVFFMLFLSVCVQYLQKYDIV